MKCKSCGKECFDIMAVFKPEKAVCEDCLKPFVDAMRKEMEKKFGIDFDEEIDPAASSETSA